MAVVAYFVLLGMAEGIWVTRIPAAKQRLHLSDGLLGVVLLVGPGGLVLAMLVAGRLTDRLGSARLVRPAGIAVAFLPGALWLTSSLPALVLTLLGFGVTAGLLDVSMNAQGVWVEREYRRPLMTSFHASYSLGGLSGAMLGGLLAGARPGAAATFLGLTIPLATGAAVAGHWLLTERRPGSSSAPRPIAGTALRPMPGPEPRPGGGPGLPAPRPAGAPVRGSSRLLILGSLALCCLVCEGTAGNWSGVYLRDNLGMSGGPAAAGFAAFCVAMAAGRLAGDRLAARFGPVSLVRGCSLLAAIGLVGGLVSNDPVGAVAGFALFGAGLSCTVPQLLSAAGNTDPGRPGSAIARVASVGYIGLVGGPVLIGGCAAVTGLPLALGLPAALGLLVAACARVLDPAWRSAAPVVSGTGPAPPAGSRSR